MLDLFEINTTSLSLTLVSSFLVGIGGSFHCAGMCGPLFLLASKREILSGLFYHFGRLLSYFLLISMGLLIGRSIEISSFKEELAILTPLTFGILLIFWGVNSFRGKVFHLKGLPYPKKVLSFIHKFQMKYLREFFLGLMTLFLPCGFLYATLFTLLGILSHEFAFLSVLFFWMGTLPTFFLTRNFFHGFLNRFKLKNSPLVSFLLMGLGVYILFQKVYLVYATEIQTCH